MRFHRIITSLLVVLFSALAASDMSATTPVEDLVAKYKTTKGARSLMTSGATMVIARPLIKKTPVAPIAEDVNDLAVLRMHKAPEQIQKQFKEELAVLLEDYVYMGKQKTRSGIAELYIRMTTQEYVEELIVYYSELSQLNSLRGKFKPEVLLKIHKPYVEE